MFQALLLAASLPLPQAPPAVVAPAPRTAARLDHARLLKDVETLASPAFQGRRPGTEGHQKAQAHLEARLREIGLPPLGAAHRAPYTELRGGTNFVAVAQGTARPASCIIVTAHDDHLGIRRGQLFPGADDNASGTAAVLALAAWFKAHPPRHTVIFALFDEEERDMSGSRSFVAAAPWKPMKPLLNLNADMLGRSAKGELWISGLRHWPEFAPVVAAFQAKVNGGPRGLAIRTGHDTPGRPKPDEDWSTASDHASFARAGIPALYVGVEDHEDYHRPTDTYANLHRAFYIRAAEALLDLVMQVDGALRED
jgi:Zn-dependent M28 family amino/carboxypeptidase